MNLRLKGITMAAGGAGLWGLMSIFSRALSAADYTSMEVAYVRCLVAGIGLALINWKKDPSILRVSKRAVITSVLFGTVTFREEDFVEKIYFDKLIVENNTQV